MVPRGGRLAEAYPYKKIYNEAQDIKDKKKKNTPDLQCH